NHNRHRITEDYTVIHRGQNGNYIHGESTRYVYCDNRHIVSGYIPKIKRTRIDTFCQYGFNLKSCKHAGCISNSSYQDKGFHAPATTPATAPPTGPATIPTPKPHGAASIKPIAPIARLASADAPRLEAR